MLKKELTDDALGQVSGGTGYTVQPTQTTSVTITGGSGSSDLVVPTSAQVYLNIPEGTTLTVQGGDAGPGAGIQVPETGTGIIEGIGTLN